MTTDDRARWNQRYSDRGHDAVALAPAALVDAALTDIVPRTGRALDVACGLGAQSMWLAGRGLDVTAIDVSDEAVRRVADAAARLGLADRISTELVDLDDGVAGTEAFDVIVCQRFRAPHLFDSFVERLVVGGLSIITVLSTVGATEPGEFHAPAGELDHAFDRPDVEVLFSAEADGEASVVIRRVSA